jgi:para-nitrobenzyl esterase
MEKTNIVETKSGKVRGYSKRGIIKFKGIPYAAAPVGDLRFSPPAPAEPWSDILDATKFGPVAPQPPSSLEAMFGEPRQQSEADCLTLNVWTPATDHGTRPVMVWIHGGGFVTGNGASLDGARLALRGNVVVVTINYRLGALGYLYIPGVTANVGQLDQIAALKWVRDNIEAFGGDPGNVTIFGESAGGTAVCTLLAMPYAKGLFHRVIAQSGACFPMAYHLSASKRGSRCLMAELGIEADDIDALRKVPVDKIIKIQAKMGTPESEAGASGTPLTFGPLIDGNTLPEHPLKAVRNGDASDIELIVGTNQDETKLWHLWNPQAAKIDDSGLHKGVHAILSLLRQDENKTKQFIKIFKRAREGKLSTAPRDIMDAFSTDYMFRIPAIRLAEAQCTHQPNTYMYLFAWKSPVMGGKLGAAHAMELPFVFGTFGESEIGIYPSKSEETEALSHKMMDCWIAFASTGNPNHDGIPEWPSYDVEKRLTMIFDREVKVVEAPFDKERAAWDGII